LRTRRKSERGTVPVHLHARLAEIGTLELWCAAKEGSNRWRLEFNVRDVVTEDHDGAPVFLARNAWHLGHAQETFPDLRFLATKEQEF
jgi:peptide subunit release factor RF-3